MPGFGGLNQREEHYVSIPDWPDSDVAGGPGPGVADPGETGDPLIPGLEHTLFHAPPSCDTGVCEAEVCRHCPCGTIVTPRHARDRVPTPSSCLLVPGRVVLRDNTETALATIQRLNRQKLQREEGIGGFFYEFLEPLIAKDLHHLQEL